MNELIENMINGNLITATKQAEAFELSEIRTALVNEYGYSMNKAILTAYWLKTGECWQESCDAE